LPRHEILSKLQAAHTELPVFVNFIARFGGI
jgi:hypothetical protein